METMQAEDRTITLTMMMEPHHASFFGTAHGGEIMRLMDTAAGCAAIKYSKGRCVTAGVYEMRFIKPVKIGSLVTCTGTIVHTGNSSLEAFVTIDAEDIRDSGRTERACEAFFTLVAVDDGGRPVPAPAYIPETEQEKELYTKVQERRGKR
jgi:uncharacterized protein (TIGR00369 family)